MTETQPPSRLDGAMRWSETCCTCRNLYPGIGERRCAAFPQGIPLAIWRDKAGHRVSYPCDGGVVYSPREEAAVPLDAGADRYDISEFLRTKG